MKSLIDEQNRIVIRRLYQDYIKKRLKLIFTTIGLLFIVSASTSLQPVLLQLAFDKVFKARDLNYLAFFPFAIIAIGIVQAVALYFSNLLLSRFNNGMVADMRKAMFEKIVNHEIEFYATYDSGNLLSRITGEIAAIAIAVQVFFNAWARQFLTSLGLLGVMLYQSVELSMVAIASLVVAFVPIIKIARRLRKLVRQANDKNAMFSTRLIESFEGIRVIKAFAKEAFEINKINKYVSEVEQISNKGIAVANLTPLFMQILAAIAVAFVIWYGGYQLIHGQMTEGNLIAFITSLLMISKPIRSLTTAGATMTAGLVNAERFYKTLDIAPKQITRGQGTPLTVKQGEIILDKVSFEYPNGTQAVTDISFIIHAGKRTALVGHSGSGKSTIFNLLLKFYDPKSGLITIDGQNITQASIDSVRGNIALVSQDIFIFDDTAKNNIGYGRDGANDGEIIAAAKAAKCHEFIMEMPQGYDTKLGFQGQNISGGQKQRIAIARAFLRNAPILLLDEATSALDPKTEGEIQEALERLTKGRTTVIIAHRLSTVMQADAMILMNQGKIEAIGTHDELMQRSRAYRDLFGI